VPPPSNGGLRFRVLLDSKTLPEASTSFESAGAAVELQREDDLLGNLGLRRVVKDLRHRERELARGDDAMARLVVRSEATNADTLLHPRGLGDFRVMAAKSTGTT
jgi:hypothetical protein